LNIVGQLFKLRADFQIGPSGLLHEFNPTNVTVGMTIRTLLCFLVLAGTLLAQDKSPQSVYKLNFLVTEKDATRTLSERKYSFAVVDNNMAAIGVIIDCKVRSVEPNVSLDCSAETSSVAAKQPVAPAGYPPVLNTMQSHFSGLLPLGTPTVLSTLDDPITNHHLEFQVTVAKL
jgi:hypothetical protein